MPKAPAEAVVKDIRGISRSRTRSGSCWAACAVMTASPRGLYYTWSKEFMEASKRPLVGDTARALKECVANLTLYNWLHKKA